MLPNSLHLPYLPITLVFYVDSTTNYLVKPKVHSSAITRPCITSEITDETLEDFHPFDPTCLGNHLSTESDINNLVKGILPNPFSVSFSKYPDYYYKYISFANEVLFIKLEPVDYEVCYDVYPPYIDYTDYRVSYEDDTIKLLKYSRVSQTLEPPTICDFNLTKKCTVIQQNDIYYLYVNNVYCGFKLADTENWVFLKDSEIWEPSCVRDFNKLTIKAGNTWHRVEEANPEQEKERLNLKTIKEYLFNLLSCM